MNKKNSPVKVILLAWLIFCCFCAQKFDLKNLQPSDWMEVGQDVLEAIKPMSEAEEISLGRTVSARLAGTFGVWKDANWTEYINVIGWSLVPYSQRPDIKYHFAILDTDEVNAYSAPGGYIFISRGLLKQLETEAELACILAHEIGHIAQKDVINEIQKSNLWKAGTKVAIAAGEDLSYEQEQFLTKLTDVAWQRLVVKGFSKEDEFNADLAGVRNAYRLGYDPYGLYNFLERLKPIENKPGEKLKILFSTHPKPSLRIAQLEKYFKKENWEKAAKPGFKDQFQQFKTNNPIP